MTPDELWRARRDLQLSVTDLASRLGLAMPNGRTMLREMESGKREISGPIAAAVRLMLIVKRSRFYINEVGFGTTFTEKGRAGARDLLEEIDQW